MKRYAATVCTVLIVSTGLWGCAEMNQTQRDTGTGAAIGGVVGGVIGAMTGGGGRGTATGVALGAALGSGAGYLWSNKMQQQKATMEQATTGTGVTVTQTADNQLKLEVPSDISFAVGRADIEGNFAPILGKFATSLNQNPVTTVRVIGHTDTTGSDAINNPLSVNRAAAVRDYLSAHGVQGSRVAIDGVGSHQSIATNDTPEGRAKNRRVEIFVGEAAPAAAR